MTAREIFNNGLKELTPLLGEGEARAVLHELFEHFIGFDKTDIILEGSRELLPYTVSRFETALGQLRDGYPVQYITGTAHFHGLNITVTPAVLIPRPETSQLVDIIESDWKDCPDLKVVDFCTGSGAIAIALAKALPFSQVTATEFSAEALAVAKDNALRQKCRIDWIEGNIFDAGSMPDGEFDVIVSNPPYIPEKERIEVSQSVLDNEPGMALFVPDDRPLCFYQAITRWAKDHITPKGKIYFEINPHYAADMKGLMTSSGFQCEIQKDMYGKSRFVIAWL